MKNIIITISLLLATLTAYAGETREIDLGETKARFIVTLDESSISMKDEFGRAGDKICGITMKSSGLTQKAFLASTATHTNFNLNAGRWCRIQPLESFIETVRANGGSVLANFSIHLSETRYEVVAGHGEPENIGKCNRNIMETVKVDFPMGRRVQFFEEKRLETTTLAECFGH